jgi:hypothetical protein
MALNADDGFGDAIPSATDAVDDVVRQEGPPICVASPTRLARNSLDPNDPQPRPWVTNIQVKLLPRRFKPAYEITSALAASACRSDFPNVRATPARVDGGARHTDAGAGASA